MTGNANTPRNVIFNADCIQAMRSFDRAAVDFILTDPPYLVNYRSRDGRTVANDDNARWLRPAFNQMHRVLKDGGFAVSFYGWNKVDLFMDAWKAAGFRIVGHIVFRKRYASSAKFLRYQHEQAYLLAKGNVSLPDNPIPDVIDFPYTVPVGEDARDTAVGCQVKLCTAPRTDPRRLDARDDAPAREAMVTDIGRVHEWMHRPLSEI